MNVECTLNSLNELKSAFRFNDAVLRELIITRNAAVWNGKSKLHILFARRQLTT